MKRLAAVAALVVAGACGSGGDSAPLSVRALLDATATTPTTAPATGESAGGPGTAPDGSSPANAGAGRHGVAPGSTAPGASPAAPVGQPGVGGTGQGGDVGGTLTIGIQYPADLGAAYAAVGANLLTGSDPWSTFIQPIVDHLNSSGGIAGREVVPVFHETDPASGSFAAQAQAVCAHFTEDEPVFAVIGLVVDPSLVDCLRDRRTPFLAQSAIVLDETVWTPNRGFLYQPFAIRSERLAPVWVDALRELGYFDGAGGVGVLRFDESNHARFSADHLRPALARHGIQVDEEVALRVPGSTAEAGDLFAGASNAALRFRAAGITHVILVPSAGALPFVFLQGAESQGYRPRYAMNSLEIPAFVAPNAPAAQLEDAVGIGWLPASDLHYSEVPHGVNPAEDLCNALTGRNGDEAKRYCEALFFLRDALALAPSLSPDGLLAGVEAIGDSFDSPWTFATRFGPGRYDGAAAVRPFAYVAGCACFRYTGEPRSIG